ncbi:MAG: hypothetical protein H6739_21690 [Alphaproteobacteria bacterium]|nr:hypothetical protein [Alphaproteobacteria bacterium]
MIRESPEEIRRLLPRPFEPDYGRLEADRGADGPLKSIAVGEVRNFHRQPHLPHFTRRDGAWFDFQILVRERRGELTIVAYDYELRLDPKLDPPEEAPAHVGPAFVRFDYNPPWHDNAADGMRAHLHLGSDDDGVVVPTPVLSPYEVLDRFLHGLVRTGRVRRLGGGGVPSLTEPAAPADRTG